METQVIRPRQIREFCGLSKTTAYRLTAAGQFPKLVKLGPRASGWLASEVLEYLSQRAAARKAAA